jgi:hypothetical protein
MYCTGFLVGAYKVLPGFGGHAPQDSHVQVMSD